MSKNSKKKMSLYKKSLIVFGLVTIVLAEFILIYVNNSLKAYEIGDIDNYMNSLIKDMQKQAKRGKIDKYFDLADVKSKYEKTSNLEKGYKELLNENEVVYKVADDKTKYEIYAADILVATVTLDDSKIEHRLGLLTYTDYQIKSIESYNKDGLYDIDFYLKDDYVLYLNGTKVEDSELKSSESVSGYEDASKVVNVPTLKHYKVTDLSYMPKVEVKDSSGKKVVHKYENYDYYATDFYKTNNHEDAMSKLAHECDPLVFAKNWSLFLTADLPGNRWGLYTLTPSLIEGTKIYNDAYKWATQVDITFTSNHTLDKEAFTNIKVTNYTIYNENAFSVEVSFDKNMTLVNGLKVTDKLDETFYYLYHDGAYRVVSMRTNEKK